MRELRRSALRVIVIVMAVALSGGSLYRNHASCMAERSRTGSDLRCSPIRLGLDLQGGMHLALEVDDPDGTLTPQARVDATDRALAVVRNRIDQFGVQERLIQKVGDDRIIVELPGVRDAARAREIIRQTAFLQFFLVQSGREYEAVRDRLARAEPALGSLLLESGMAGQLLVRERDVAEVRALLETERVRRSAVRDAELRWGGETRRAGADDYRTLWVLHDRAFLTGEEVADARPGRDPQFNEVIVSFDLSRSGGRTFERVTGQNIGRLIAIVLDDVVVSAPVIESRIGSSGRIRMDGASLEEARDLAVMLRAGALPAPLRIMGEGTVGPSLGAESVAQGRRAGMIGLALVALAMIAYYRTAGALAVAALLVYVVLVMGGLAFFDAALTLPGIAGLILSVGMAVDANVLVFERIREELANGTPTRLAVDSGFRHAMSAIVDSNLTTLLTALVLYRVGTGPVQGFAVTLSIGILASFFSAVFVTRTLFDLVLARRPPDRPIRV